MIAWPHRLYCADCKPKAAKLAKARWLATPKGESYLERSRLIRIERERARKAAS